MRTFYTCLLFSAVSCSLVSAQQLIGVQSSNYAGTNGLYLNPSSIADSRWGAFLNLGMASVQATDQPLPWAAIPFSKTKLKLRGEEQGLTQVDVRGPGVMAQFLNRHAVALTTRYRADFRATGDTELVGWLRGRTRPVPQGPKTIALQSDAYSELAVSYAASVLDWQQHFLKVGGTYKMLRGSQTIDLRSGGSWGTSSDDLLPYTIAFVESTQSDLTYLSDYTIRKAISGSAPGRGSGFDLGFTYEFRPEAEKYRYRMDGKTVSDAALTKYRLRVGVSLLDVGKVRYREAANYRLTDATGTIRQADFQNLQSTEAVQIALLLQLRRPVDITPQERTVDLPQTLVVNVDGQIGKGWFVGATLVSPRQSSATGLHRSGVVSVGPRYESSGFEFGLSGNYWRDYRKYSVSTYVRLGVFTLGSDNLLGFFSDNGLNAHAFAGVTIPFLSKRPKDNDGDYVSNRRDLCPDVAGVWVFQGCPDTDNDGIQDKDDVCPNDPGPAETKGCPDADKDGIFDKNDACPNEAGSARLNGCPDTDNVGDFDLNVKLSQERCQSVMGYLVGRGIQKSRLQSVGRGPIDPVAPNNTEENRRKNRRVEFVIL